jgi:single-stranded-DNA-specific exonuclease
VKYQEFEEHVRHASQKFRKIRREEEIRVVSHLDADGICSSSLITKALERLGYKYNLKIVKQLSEEVLGELEKEDYSTYIFTDLGSGQYELITKYLPGRNIFILDHHSYDDKTPQDNIVLVNPHSFGIDGSNEISGAGVVYMFVEALDPANKDMAHIAVIGALGDVQEKEGFSGMNMSILKTAIEAGKVKVEKSLKWFGIETKPLYNLLAYSDIFIPGVSRSESGAIQFLQEIGINPKTGDSWTRYNDLTEEQKGTLISSIVMKRNKESSPEDILCNRYILLSEPEFSPLRDLKEFATLLNACGRMDKAAYGVGACLNDEVSKKKALETLAEYRKEIVHALRWYDEGNHVAKGEGYIIINAEDKVMPTIIGTLASIISNSPELKPGTKILSLARDANNITKVSLRVAGNSDEDLREILSRIAEKTGGESGGHKNAAGAIIPTSVEKEFIDEAIKIFT